MILEQVLTRDLGCAAYVVGCDHVGQAIVVDPPLHVQPVLDVCRQHGLELVGVIETHTHADHVAGHGVLAAAARRVDRDPSARAARVRVAGDRRRRPDRPRARRAGRPAHAGPPARALLHRDRGSRARRRALDPPDGRLAVRRRRRAARPRGRGRRGRRGPLPLAASADSRGSATASRSFPGTSPARSAVGRCRRVPPPPSASSGSTTPCWPRCPRTGSCASRTRTWHPSLRRWRESSS